MGGLTIIKHVRVFDGESIHGPKTAVIEGSRIGNDALADDPDPSAVEVVDGSGCTLLPGLIDCHVHILDEAQLAACASYGVTTVCDMACVPLEKYVKLRAAKGPTTWLSSSLPAYEENSRHGMLFKLARVTPDHAVHNTEEAAKFVQDRVDEEVDYIKIIADFPGHEQAVLDRIQVEAKKHGKMTVAHTAQYHSFERGVQADFDILTHVPSDKALDNDIIGKMVSQKTVAVPTLTMMQVMADSWVLWLVSWILPSFGRRNFQASLDSVTMMRDAGVPIVAGTDANNSGIFSIVPGKSLHHELELLVRAGLTPLEALRSATSLAAQHFNLPDRGRISPGLRADLALVEGNPDEDIAATARILKVWSNGEEATIPAQNQRASLGSCAVM
ncbi:putative hydrolase [Annulohypoxylon truncatum]|uniref:putative hydrolase n=1 Tax=Annulohypoxylon truncatum TaxID=327061 RepID=UPI002008C698|nr:putative hydrolase [Annulohypoxylon truncatum]KAI1210399.1 putative hydrolase [Annulohypoxylon truncatum]